ncbi:MFS transporter [Paenarthrobacter sp. YAF11_1]|uniref:MFS transporter n=1 Tax=Paenarthrobacter sp. YAF11_1 TaxID=3233074 RepID=UPI003F96FE21
MSSTSSKTMSVQELLDSAPLSPRQRIIVLVAFLAMLAEGLDITIASHVYPHIIREWGTSMTGVTFTVTVGVVAMAVGGLIAGPAADRYGRKGVLIAGLILFGTTTAAMGFSSNIELFSTFRIVSCLGLGAVMPVVITLVADWMPADRRAQMVTLSFSGVALGSIVGGYLAAVIIPNLDWNSVLLIAGLIPLVLIPFVAGSIPEAPGVLISRGLPPAKIRSVIAAVVPARSLDALDLGNGQVPPAERRSHRERIGAFRIILSPPFLGTTLLMWLAYFIGLGVLFLILNYLPLMLSQAGRTAGETGLIVATFGWGGLVGQVLAAFALKKFNRFHVVSILWALGIVGLLVVANFSFDFAGFMVVAFAVGLTLPSVNAALNALAALAYPDNARATGLGAASGAGRAGTLTSGLLGGLMIGAGWGISSIFLALTGPIVLGIIAVQALRVSTRSREQGELVDPKTSIPH